VTDVEYAVGISTELRLALAKRCNYKSLYSLQLTTSLMKTGCYKF
jgi:hypothetical protein